LFSAFDPSPEGAVSSSGAVLGNHVVMIYGGGAHKQTLWRRYVLSNQTFLKDYSFT